MLSIVILAAVVILAASLHDVRFAPGRTISFNVPEAKAPALAIGQTFSDIPLWKLLLFWLLFVVNLVLFFLLLPPEMRKRILRQLVSMALTVLAILIILRYKLIRLPALEGQPTAAAQGGNLGLNGNGQLPTFQPPHLSAWWTFLISFLVLGAVLTLLWLTYRWWMRNSVQHAPELDLIGAIARSSLDDIAAGRDWTDVVIQSYIQMSETVSVQRGLQRAAAVTPREFANRLEQAGLPPQAVQRLTRLFESARYGAKASSQDDINEAVACLNSILRACGLPQ